MPENARRDRPGRSGRIFWMALRSVGSLVVVVALVGGCGSSSGGAGRSGRGRPGQRGGSGRCPSHEFEVAASQRPGAEQILVPAGASSVVLCRYGTPGHDRLLVSRVIRSQHMTRGLARDLNALRKRNGTFACPLDIGPRLIAVFWYPRGADNPVTVDLSGCNPVSNGHVNRPGLGRPVIGRLARLVPSRTG